ncbi:argininosuccinate lyase [Candidatus Woesearchaeota archaeon]|nr:argininosuccinate lyase [Candidatus Woesearchaeota archaeon]
MTKLWDKGYKLNKEAEEFTVGEDYLLDQKLVKADCVGSIAHATILNKIGILKNDEFNKLKKELKNIIELEKKGKFVIKQEQEDVHTAIENHLTNKLGDVGKKIHTCRSRNDQVIADTRLYAKEKLIEIEEALLKLCETLLSFAEKNKNIPMPGYTHTQRAMPSSVGLLAGAFLESLLDDLILLKTAYKLNNQCPLGSAAGYGASLPIDRQLVSDLLGFEKVQNNVIYVQNSRGKIESIILSALTQIMLDLSKLATNLILFSTVEFGYFSIPKEFCSGSSIMPQKVNPCVLELVRAKASIVEGYMLQINGIINNLLAGYNRDLQLTKEPLMKGIDLTLDSINIMGLIISKLKVNKEKCIEGCSPEIFATDYALDLVRNGTPFRDAYKVIAKNVGKLKKIDPVKNIKNKKHLGATGNLGLGKINKEISKEKTELVKEKNKFDEKIKELFAKP